MRTNIKLVLLWIFSNYALQDLQPPKDLYIEVRVVVDCGEIMTDTGSVNLEAGTVHFLRRSDVEHLIRQGMLEQMAN